MTNLERVAYIRGLAEGLELDTDKKEVKVLDAMLTLLEDMALSISDLEEAYEDMADQLDAVDEDLCTLEDDFYEEDKCCEDCEDDDDEFYYEVTCPNCQETICRVVFKVSVTNIGIFCTRLLIYQAVFAAMFG